MTKGERERERAEEKGSFFVPPRRLNGSVKGLGPTLFRPSVTHYKD